MIATIHKNKHRSFPPIIGIVIHPWMERDVMFDSSAAYDLPEEEDDDDVNKLFGIGYINGGHHQDSARFGWNYNKETGKVRLFGYCYVNGKRIIQQICEVPRHKKVQCHISIALSNYYYFVVYDADRNSRWMLLGEVSIPFTYNKKWKYMLGCYFGGNQPAPHTIKIKIAKK